MKLNNSARICACCIALLFAAWAPRLRAEDVTVSFASLGAAYMDHLVAIEKGYMAEDGLSVKIIRSGGGSATQTLLSGQLHFSSSAGGALCRVLRGGPIKVVYTNQSRPTYKLLSNKPEIKTLQDLVGKTIAINTFGDTGHLATLLLMKKYRFDPRSFLFIAVRSEARFPAFLSGSVDASPLTPRDISQIGPTRGYVIADLSKEIQLVWNGVAVSNKLLSKIRRWSSAICAPSPKDGELPGATKKSPSPWSLNTIHYRRRHWRWITISRL